MAAFQYTALDQAGRQQKGMLEADSVRQIRQMLRDRNLVPLNVAATTTGKEDRSQNVGASWFARRLGALDRVLFTRQMATLISAGLPIEEALAATAAQSEKQHVGAVVMGIRSKVLEGFSLHAALAEYSGSFSHLYRSTVAAGEQSGYLDRVLENLADYTESQYESGREVEMALFYPVMLFAMALLIVGSLMVYVVPDMVGVLENMGQELPTMTQFLILTSETLRDYWWLLFLVIGVLVFGVRWLLRQRPIRLAWDKRKLSLPILGRVSRSANAARYANTMSILTSSGVPVVDGMRISAEVVSNQFLRGRLLEATQAVSEGSSMRQALEKAGYFPAMLLHMVGSGEASGELDTMLSRVARYQQAEVERTVNTLVRMFEPLMLIFMGGLVMFIVMAILVPILNMNQLV